MTYSVTGTSGNDTLSQTLDVGPGTNKGIPQNLESTAALNVLGAAAGEGATAPTEVVIDCGDRA